MKDQYFGDAGDYGKYGLLRFIAEKGIKIGVHWYLTDSDDSNDGKHTAYLSDKKMNKRKRRPQLIKLSLSLLFGKFNILYLF